MKQVYMLKPQFSIGSGMAITLIWLMVSLSAFLGLLLMFSVVSLIIPYITCPAGYWQINHFSEPEHGPMIRLHQLFSASGLPLLASRFFL